MAMIANDIIDNDNIIDNASNDQWYGNDANGQYYNVINDSNIIILLEMIMA